MSSTRDWLTIKQAARLMSVSEQTLRRWDRAGKLTPERHPGNRYRLYSRAKILALVEEQRGAAAAPAPARTNLSIPLAGFVGRDRAIAALDAAFAHGARLVTVVGPPGVGKTRLAQRHAELWRTRFLASGGVWIVDATGMVREGNLRASLAELLRVFPSASLPVVAEAMSRRGPLLLVVDNAEGLASGARATLRALGEAAPDARILVTSRHRLHVEGETAIELEPLPVPPEGAPVAAILASEAVRLLLLRGGAMTALTDDMARDLGALARALGGLPLAVELAAAHLDLLTPRDLLARLGTPLDLAARGEPATPRHASLRDAMDASWALLDKADQSVLAQCAAFGGGFSIEAAEAVIELPGGRTVLPHLARLRDRSLVAVHPASPLGTTRLVLYPSIQSYAAERLHASGAEQGARGRHARHYLENGERWARDVRERGDLASRQRLTEERDNLFEAFRRALALCLEGSAPRRDPASDAVRLALCLDVPLAMQGRAEELGALLDEVEPLARKGDRALYARVLLARGHARGTAGQLARSIVEIEGALDHAAAVGDPVLEGEARTLIMVRYRQAGRFDDAVRAGERGAALLGASQSRRLEAVALVNLGLVLGEIGRSSAARDHDERARRISRELGDRWSEGLALGNLAQLDQAAGAFDQSRYLYGEALRAFAEAGDLLLEATYRGFTASLSHELALRAVDDEARAHADEAREGYAAALETLSKIRATHIEGLIRGYAGAFEAAFGETERALRELDRARGLVVEAGVPAFLAALDVFSAQVDVQRARSALGTTAAVEAERRAEHCLAAAAPGASTSSDVRTAVRMLRAALARARREGAAPPPGAWRIGADGRQMLPPGGEPISLARRGAMSRILRALAVERLRAPGAALSHAALIEAGWPGERVIFEAGTKRVRVAVASLRALGLRDALLTRDDGYLLDPAVTFVGAERGAPA